MSEKLGQFRATHDNPQGSDYTFIPDESGNAIGHIANGVVKGLARGRSVEALNHRAVDPKDPAVMSEMIEAHDTNQWILGEGPYSSQKAAEQVPNRKKKKRRH